MDLEEGQLDLSDHSCGDFSDAASETETGSVREAAGGGTSDPTGSALQDFLTEIQPAETSSAIEASSSNHQHEDELLELLALEAKEKRGPPVHGSVAKLINTHLGRNFSSRLILVKQQGSALDEETSQSALVIKKIKTYEVPDNMPELCTSKVNSGVYKALSASAKRESGAAQVVDTALCKSITAQSRAMGKLVKIKQMFPNVSSELNDVFKLLADAAEFSTFAKFRVNESRRDNILASLNTQYSHLSCTTKPGDGLLFGSDLEGAMKSVETANRLSQKLAASHNKISQKSFLAGSRRGRGRSRGGYHSQKRYRPQNSQYRRDSPPPAKKQQRLVILNVVWLPGKTLLQTHSF